MGVRSRQQAVMMGAACRASLTRCGVGVRSQPLAVMMAAACRASLARCGVGVRSQQQAVMMGAACRASLTRCRVRVRSQQQAVMMGAAYRASLARCGVGVRLQPLAVMMAAGCCTRHHASVPRSAAAVKPAPFFLHFDRKSGLLLAAVLPALLALGFWQVDRAAQKDALEAAFAAHISAPATNILYLRSSPELAWKRVRVEGHYDNERLWYLDNRIYRGQVGFDLISPLRTAGGRLLLVNRGWRAGDPARRRLPQEPPVPGPVSLEGHVYIPPGKPLLLAPDTPGAGWPKLVQTVDIPAMSTALNEQVFPHLVRLDPGQSGTGPSDWRPYFLSAARHRGYALTWFSLAGVLLLLFLARSVRQRRVASIEDGDVT